MAPEEEIENGCEALHNHSWFAVRVRGLSQTPSARTSARHLGECRSRATEDPRNRVIALAVSRARAGLHAQIRAVLEMSPILRVWSGLSEGENQTGGRHGSMGELVHAQWAQPEIGDFVDEAPVFRPNCYVHCQRHISAGSIYERSSGLLAHGVDIVGIEDHGAATG